MIEVWKDVVEFPTHYQVSNIGNIRRKAPYVNQSKAWDSNNKILSFRLHTNGYQRVMLSINGKHYDRYVHRLVAEAFCENPNNYNEVNHIDGNKDNNHVSNLEWVTPMQNTHHAIRTGLRGNLTEEQLKHMSEASKRTWQREDYRRKQSEIQKASWAKNKAERSKAIKEGIWRAKDAHKENSKEVNA